MNLSVFEVRRIAIGRGEAGGEIVRRETLDLDQYRSGGVGVDLTEGPRQMLFEVVGFEEVELDVAQVALVVRDVSPPCTGRCSLPTSQSARSLLICQAADIHPQSRPAKGWWKGF